MVVAAAASRSVLKSGQAPHNAQLETQHLKMFQSQQCSSDALIDPHFHPSAIQHPQATIPHFSTFQNSTAFCSLLSESFNMNRHWQDKEKDIEMWYQAQTQILVQKQRSDELFVANSLYPGRPVPKGTSQEYKDSIQEVTKNILLKK